MINDEEYDCIGWLGKKRGLQDLDLAIEIYFPKPQNDNETYELPFAVEKTRRMREKLRKLNAKRKYILIGVPPNKVITTTEIVHLDMKTVYQRHKFGKMRMVKQTKLKV